MNDYISNQIVSKKKRCCMHGDVMRVVQYIKDHYTEKITLADAAVIAHLNQNYFSKLFHEEVGCTFIQFLNYVRVDSSISLLKGEENMRITDIAMQCGFDNLTRYLHNFKKSYGISPTEYRRHFFSLDE